MMDMIFKFYGTDWAAVIFAFLHLHFLGDKRIWGFTFGALSNLCWFAFAVMVGSMAQILANIVFFALNVRGFYKWYKAAKGTESHE